MNLPYVVRGVACHPSPTPLPHISRRKIFAKAWNELYQGTQCLDLCRIAENWESDI